MSCCSGCLSCVAWCIGDPFLKSLKGSDTIRDLMLQPPSGTPLTAGWCTTRLQLTSSSFCHCHSCRCRCHCHCHSLALSLSVTRCHCHALSLVVTVNVNLCQCHSGLHRACLSRIPYITLCEYHAQYPPSNQAVVGQMPPNAS
jgi:hypothetical protein